MDVHDGCKIHAKNLRGAVLSILIELDRLINLLGNYTGIEAPNLASGDPRMQQTAYSFAEAQTNPYVQETWEAKNGEEVGFRQMGGPDADERPEVIMFGGVPMTVEPKKHCTATVPKMISGMKRYQAECECGWSPPVTYGECEHAELACAQHIRELHERQQALTYDEIIAREA